MVSTYECNTLCGNCGGCIGTSTAENICQCVTISTGTIGFSGFSPDHVIIDEFVLHTQEAPIIYYEYKAGPESFDPNPYQPPSRGKNKKRRNWEK